jgi:hypothetical protein
MVNNNFDLVLWLDNNCAYKEVYVHDKRTYWFFKSGRSITRWPRKDGVIGYCWCIPETELNPIILKIDFQDSIKIKYDYYINMLEFIKNEPKIYYCNQSRYVCFSVYKCPVSVLPSASVAAHDTTCHDLGACARLTSQMSTCAP